SAPSTPSATGAPSTWPRRPPRGWRRSPVRP
ncbi:MAG: hypothetical protein AVDCRST_MAG33-1251, partial [uncultured Thermomicrobiales bacterium]